MLKKSEIKIIDLFRKNVFLSKTIREISIMLKKSYPKVYGGIIELEKEKIIKIRKVGNSKICELNFSKEAISILSFLDRQDALARDIKNVDKITEFREFSDDIILVSGSYAKGKQTAKSDIDLVIITKTGAFEKQKLIENLTKLFLPKVHPIAISYKDFVGMLLDKKENYGKEVFRSRLLFKNSEIYYDLIKEAVENGFRG